MATPVVRKSTPVLPVDRIEPCLAFWARLGFEPTVSVPGPEGLGFVILSNGKAELMYQTRASIADDVPAFAAAAAQGHTFLFLEVEDIDAVAAALAGEPVVLPRRETFYGAIEIGWREPGGHTVTFAQFAAP